MRRVLGLEDTIATDLLADRVPNRRLETNVEFYTAILLDGVGVPKALFTPTFAISRVGGWMAHALEQLGDNRLTAPAPDTSVNPGGPGFR
ncbi:citrate/2-methylcitrate synthase [Haloglomus litoreum]|uniref:citrate/2-methylcitrate synthase n=1 Tax=Haloglomus litoreum TaxID=3034026 RepID=UPI0023E8135E|nr:citrate/2-methylcitrate synthase [Haloglomus sp. DT116]